MPLRKAQNATKQISLMGGTWLINFRVIVFSFYRCRDGDKVPSIIFKADASRVEKANTIRGGLSWRG